MPNEHNLTLEDLESLELDEFDASEYLSSDEAIAAYLTEALECGDAGLVAQALGNVARARGMAEIAQKTGLARESLYKALRANSQPRLDTVSKVLSAFNLRLVAEVIPPEQRATMPSALGQVETLKKPTIQRSSTAKQNDKPARTKILATKKKALPA
ncbi:addiction module antidote protein [Rugamonas sp. CCM 8940]|uniref:addiction module antidote protein n=1 Tax=Rugamonas sp. CCM 8940 TaxID=2765359 RepID=UPI0018F4BC90|nr:putative addiction module antidote protein [Rugamonas sp. CCM 8940]